MQLPRYLAIAKEVHHRAIRERIPEVVLARANPSTPKEYSSLFRNSRFVLYEITPAIKQCNFRYSREICGSAHRFGVWVKVNVECSTEFKKSRCCPQRLHTPSLVGPLGAAITQWWAQCEKM